MTQPYRAYPMKGTGLALTARRGARISSGLLAALALARVAARSRGRSSLFRRAQLFVLRFCDAGLRLVEGDPRAPLRGMNSPQGPELPLLRSAQRGLIGPPRAGVIAPSEQRQHSERNRNGKGNHARMDSTDRARACGVAPWTRMRLYNSKIRQVVVPCASTRPFVSISVPSAVP